MHLVGFIIKKPRLRFGGAVPPLPLYSFVTRIGGGNFTVFIICCLEISESLRDPYVLCGVTQGFFASAVCQEF